MKHSQGRPVSFMRETMMERPRKIATERINAVYQKYGRSALEPRGSKNDPESKAAIEQSACRRAYTALEYHDRDVMDHALRVLSAKAGLQQNAAFYVLMRIGILLGEMEK